MKDRDLALPHAAPLVAYADEVGAHYGHARGVVPYPDPEHGGTQAEVLFVLSHPGRATERRHGGSGLLSLENDDPTSHACFDQCVRVGLGFERITHWNAIPFPLPTGVTKPRAADWRAGAQWLPGLLDLLPHLKIVALLGTTAQSAWRAGCDGSALPTIDGPSPGERGLSNDGARQRLHEVFDHIAGALEGG